MTDTVTKPASEPVELTQPQDLTSRLCAALAQLGDEALVKWLDLQKVVERLTTGDGIVTGVHLDQALFAGLPEPITVATAEVRLYGLKRAWQELGIVVDVEGRGDTNLFFAYFAPPKTQ